MDQEIASQAGSYRRLGYKAFTLFALQRCAPAIVILLVTFGLVFLSGMNLPASYAVAGSVSVDPHQVILQAVVIGFALFTVFLVLGIFLGWLAYITYEFQVDDDALKIKRGILSKEITAIPYRQIQDVDVQRDFVYLIFGLSKLVILTAGHEDKAEAQDESEGVLPALDKDVADRLQEDLLRRANVEKVTPAVSGK